MNLAAHIESLQSALSDRDLELLTAKQLLREALDCHDCKGSDCWCHNARRLCYDSV